MNIKPKILLVGHGRHGKDTVAEILQMFYGFSYYSSSEWCADKVCFPALKDKYGYETVQQCFEDRHNHRSEWYDLIAAYCQEDPTRLGREIFQTSDIYCGLRNKREFHFMRNARVFDFSIWVDRSDHLPPEPADSMNIEPWMADFIIDNNGSRDDLTFAVKQLMDNLLGVHDPKVTEMSHHQEYSASQTIKLDF